MEGVGGVLIPPVYEASANGVVHTLAHHDTASGNLCWVHLLGDGKVIYEALSGRRTRPHGEWAEEDGELQVRFHYRGDDAAAFLHRFAWVTKDQAWLGLGIPEECRVRRKRQRDEGDDGEVPSLQSLERRFRKLRLRDPAWAA